MDEKYGVCLSCGDGCNKSSQSCGRCMRRAIMVVNTPSPIVPPLYKEGVTFTIKGDLWIGDYDKIFGKAVYTKPGNIFFGNMSGFVFPAKSVSISSRGKEEGVIKVKNYCMIIPLEYVAGKYLQYGFVFEEINDTGRFEKDSIFFGPLIIKYEKPVDFYTK